MAEEEVRKLVLPYDHTQLPTLLASIKNETELRTFILEYAEAKGTSLTESQVNTLIAAYITENNIGSGNSQSGTGLTPEQSQKLAMLLTDGNGSKYLGDDGNYHNTPRDGVDGQNGTNGVDGSDGVGISNITASQSGENVTLTISLTDGTSNQVTFTAPQGSGSGVTTEQIVSAVNSYLTQNPVSGVSVEDQAKLEMLLTDGNGSKYLGDDGNYHNIPAGDAGTSIDDATTSNASTWSSNKIHQEIEGKTISQSQINNAVSEYLTENPPSGVTSETIANAVSDYISANGITVNNLDIKQVGVNIINGTYRKIICVGDSITDGYGGTGYNGSQSTQISTNTNGYCWCNLFKQFVHDRYGTTVINKGMYGSTSHEQENNISNIMENDTDLYILLTGTNNRNHEAYFSRYEESLSRLIASLKSGNADLLVLSNIPSTKSNDEANPATTQQTAEIAETVCYGKELFMNFYIKYNEYLSNHDINNADTFYDHVHPNDLGYYIMFTILCNEIGLPLSPHINYRQNGGYFTPESVVPCTNVSLSDSTLSFTDNSTQTITASLTPSYTTDTLSWASSNTSVATVLNGVVTPVGNGSATITATCGTQTATCSVTVNYSSPSTTKTREQVLTENPFMSEYYNNLADEKPNFVLTRTFNNTDIYYLICWSDGDVTGDAMFGNDGNNERLFFIYNASTTLTVRKYVQSTDTWSNGGLSVTDSSNDNETKRAGYFMINGNLGNDVQRQKFINNNMVYSTIDVKGYDTDTTSATNTVFFNANVS